MANRQSNAIHKFFVMINDIIASLKAKYEKTCELMERRGRIHDYLDITVDFTISGKFILNMQKHIKKVLAGLPEAFNGEATTAADDHLLRT